MSTFVEDFPYLDFAQARRLGYRLPIKTIVPSYMLVSPVFVDLFDAIDKVFDRKVYEKTEILGNLRNMWASNPQVEQLILDNKIVSLEDWSLPERDIVGKQLNLLGLQLGESAALFTASDFTTLCRFLGMYWFEKGTKTFLDYVNFCCGTHYRMYNLWSKDYKTFYPEGDSHIGTPIWEDGEWYPTTHINFVTSDSETNILALALLFNELANYNLVLNSITVEFNMKITNGHGYDGLLFSTALGYHIDYRIKTYSPLKESQKEMFGFEGTERRGYDLARFAEDDYDDSIQNSSGVQVDPRPHAFYAVSVTPFSMSYPVITDTEGLPLETPIWQSALGAWGYCVTEAVETSDSYGLLWAVAQPGGGIVQKYDDEDPFNITSLFTVRNGIRNGYVTYLLREDKEKALIVERMDATGKELIIEPGADFCIDSLFTSADAGKQIMIKVTQQD